MAESLFFAFPYGLVVYLAGQQEMLARASFSAFILALLLAADFLVLCRDFSAHGSQWIRPGTAGWGQDLHFPISLASRSLFRKY